MNYIYSKENIYQEIERLNTLQDNYCKWRQVKARKEHIDEFGVKISRDEVYYKKELGSAYEVLKLSRESMDRFLYVLFNTNYRLQTITDKIIEQEKSEINRKMNELFSGLGDEEE